jgi:transcription elongation GreA/GreB family factor
LADLPTISNESPIWSSILWKQKWDEISVKAASWTYKYKILEIK